MTRPSRPRRPPRPTPAWAGAALALAVACKQEAPPGAEPAPSAVPPVRQVGTPTLPSGFAASPPESPPEPAASAAPSAEPVPYAGPYFVVTDGSAGVYAGLSFSKKGKLGYLRSGSKVPVIAGTVPGEDCAKGFYRLRDGGYVCSSAGTTNLSSPEARFSIKQPDMTTVLPYTYARNAKNGTPLYRSVPTMEQMNQYEPYLVKKAEDSDKKVAAPKPVSAAAPKVEDTVLPFSKEAIEQAKKRDDPKEKDAEHAPAAEKADPATEHADTPDGGAEEDKPWWQRHDVDKRLHEVKLDELEADADDILAKRMVKGFYVAVDREFNWNGRLWYKTTKGLVAPADRFWVTQGPEFKGVELDGDERTLPIGWTYGYAKSRPKYAMDASGKLTPSGSLDYHGFVALSGKDQTIAGKKYLETKDGSWVLASQLRVTMPGPPPADIGPDERWVDVNLTTQTLVAFEGTKPVFATLVSSGKHNQDKEKDHSSPTGDFRIREKHVTTTMDGDGSAAGDLPYSIEDVPYVMYFHKAYALHGAFWHSNYGVQMSHGCVNLAPLDAKWIFLFTEPHLPEGWHGVWATQSHPGSRVVIHE
ncbi:MAG TPA: L,D-transpeptidase family protein [Polyangiaceae bacterium]|nr:L,D-transpeptidase family protein [Polyangiaceae bacterium]